MIDAVAAPTEISPGLMLQDETSLYRRLLLIDSHICFWFSRYNRLKRGQNHVQGVIGYAAPRHSQCCFPMLKFEEKYRSEMFNASFRLYVHDT